MTDREVLELLHDIFSAAVTLEDAKAEIKWRLDVAIEAEENAGRPVLTNRQRRALREAREADKLW